MAHSVRLQRTKAFNTLFQNYEGPAFAVRLWDGWSWSSSESRQPAFTIVLEDPRAFAALIAQPNEVTLGEAFIRGGLDVEGDIFSVFSVAEHIFNRPHSLRRAFAEKLAATVFGFGQWFRHGFIHSQRRDRASIAYHYDQPVAFFAPWLGRTFAYSCAYFRCAEDPLDRAQEQKLELICQKLRLQPHERFLDIGCGWGSLLLHAARRHGVEAHGITLSRNQAATTKRRIAEEGLESCCDVDLRDYRDLKAGREPFDKIASVGMYEHVGLKNLPAYFQVVHDLLRPGGVFLNHGIARAALSPMRENSFIDHYVFPSGHLVTLTQALAAAESRGLEVRDVENLREHYNLTLRRWVEGLRRNADSLLQQVSKTTYRIWLLYMAGSAAAFRRGDIGVYQVLFSRPDRGNSRIPLTRDDWYATSALDRVVEV
jgi:cyclopropane-fatty-acyl-phospholipid synthase